MALQSGDLILNGKYRIEELAGKGAFAEVYRAAHIELKATRAIKVLRADAPGVGSTVFNDYRERFTTEFQIAAQLDNPNVTKVYDLFEENGALYAVLEYATGGSVRNLIVKQGALPVDRAVQILLDCAAGLDALHELEIIHRDIKPSNILLDKGGRAKIADLGLAQVGGGQSSLRSELGSAAGLHPGTPNYRSPEHNSWEPLTPTSDVYSLGCVAFEMLTGQAWKQVMHKAERVSDLRRDAPEWLDTVVVRMLCDVPGLRKSDMDNPQKRYVSMEAVATAIREGINGSERARREAEEGARREAEVRKEREHEAQIAEEAKRREEERQAQRAEQECRAKVEEQARREREQQEKKEVALREAERRKRWLAWIEIGIALVAVCFILALGGISIVSLLIPRTPTPTAIALAPAAVDPAAPAPANAATSPTAEMPSSFFDTFDSTQYLQQRGDVCKDYYDNGQYHFKLTKQFIACSENYPRQYINVNIEADITMYSGEGWGGGGAGIIFGSKDSSNYYQFIVTRLSGSYEVSLLENGEWKDVRKWNTGSRVNGPDANGVSKVHLKLAIRDQRVQVYSGSTLLDDLAIPEYLGGQVGLIALAFGQDADVGFNSFKVEQLQ